MTNHAVDREEVMAFLDGELAMERAADVETHISGCSECRALVASLREVSGRLQPWSVEPPPASVTFEPRPARRTAWWNVRGRFGLPRWVIVGVPAAAVLVLSVVWDPNAAKRAVSYDAVSSRSVAEPMAKRTEDQPDTNNAAIPTGNVGGMSPGGGPSKGRLRVQGQQGQQGQQSGRVTGPMIARSVSLTIVTDQFADARAAVERLTAAVQGTIGSLNVTGDPPARRSLRATLRVPADRLDAALLEVRKIGTVRQESQSSEDVSDAHRDLVVRIDNATKEEARLNDILRNRTGRLQDVLAVEQEVTRVRGEIEQMKAEELAMRNRVTYATISVDIAEAYKAEVTLGSQPIGVRLRNATVDGWRSAASAAFDIVLFVLEAGPSVLLWMLVIGPPAWWLWRRAHRTV